MSDHNAHTDDPCAVEDRYHKQAYIWFIAVILIAVTMTYNFAKIDRWMFDTDAKYLDEGKYRANRLAATMLGSESTDERRDAELSGALKKLDRE